MSDSKHNVPFTDIYVDEKIQNDVIDILKSKRYVKGHHLTKFENMFAKKVGVNHAIGVNNGTSAILLSLLSLNIADGDDVFVPGHTFFATVSPILSVGANPIFIDVHPTSLTIDINELSDSIERSKNPRAIIPVHIYGHMADMNSILELSEEYNLAVIEDACQSHFAERDGYTAGQAGKLGAFSFYPSKNMTVGGDGGMIVTNDPAIAKRARQLRNHGRNKSGEHVRLGLNYRLDEIKAAIGLRQLEHVKSWNDSRNEAAQRYTEHLSSVDEVTTPSEVGDTYHVYHLYVIQADERDSLQEHLENHGIDTGIHYPTPAHKHRPVVERCGEVRLEQTERLCQRILSLPMHPRITGEEIDYVCETIEGFYDR